MRTTCGQGLYSKSACKSIPLAARLMVDPHSDCDSVLDNVNTVGASHCGDWSVVSERSGSDDHRSATYGFSQMRIPGTSNYTYMYSCTLNKS